MKVSKEFIDVLAQLSLIASSDPTRLVFNYVRVRKIGEALELAATDGHRACIRNLPLSSVDAFEGEVLIDALKPSIKAMQANAKVNPHAMIDISQFVDSTGLKYPDLDRVTREPLTRDETIVVGLNAEYLEEMLRALREEKRTTSVKLVFKGKLEMGEGGEVKLVGIDNLAPITVAVGCNKGVLMPVRL